MKIENKQNEELTLQELAERDRQLALEISNKLAWEFPRSILVKPFEDLVVEKNVETPVPTGETEKDENGTYVPKYDVKKETKPVVANFKSGIVIKVPYAYDYGNITIKPEVGDIIIFARKGTGDFEYFQDSLIVDPYAIVAIRKGIQA
jgi:hypothetical protein